MSVDWSKRSALPPAERAALQALQFDPEIVGSLDGLSDLEWRGLLARCDRMQITLVLAEIGRPGLPEWVRERTDRDICNNRERQRRQLLALEQADTALREPGVEYVLLKGFTHGGDYAPFPWLRHQCDLDFFSHPEKIVAARRVLTGLGYKSLGRFAKFPMDHLPPMMGGSGHPWRGDFFDPDLPIVFELHFQWWDEATEKLPASGLDEFWARRATISLGGRAIPALDARDRIAYAALHALRHLLRGDLKVFHLYEIAHFLHHRAEDDRFWLEWEELQSPETTRYAATLFGLARLWFACRIPERVSARIDELPEKVKRWYCDYAASPLEARFRPNKDELWLHLALLPEGVSAWSVAARKLVPQTLPVPPDEVLSPESRKGFATRLGEFGRYRGQLAARVSHHARALPGLARGLMKQAPRYPAFGASFWTYLAAASLYHLGVFVFVLLYNLHLTDLGYDESFVGLVTTSMTVGSLAGALPAGHLAQRLGLRPTLLICFIATPTVAAMRSMVSAEPALLGSAFLAGVFFSIWVVSIAPTIAQLVPERLRARAFSVFFAASIATGVGGGMLGGVLPDWLSGQTTFADLSAKQAGLLAGCAIAAVSLLPGLRIRGLTKATAESGRYPRSPFIRRFLPVVFLWSLPTGAFNPFFNVYFARYLELSTPQIGRLFSVGQLAQVGAVLLAPLLLARIVRVSAIAAVQIAAGIGLLLMAFREPLWLPCVAYLAYMSFQWMSEPGLYSLLMREVDDTERAAASSLNYIVVFSAHATAAALAGRAISRWSYPSVLVVAAVLAVVAGVLFRFGLARFEREDA